MRQNNKILDRFLLSVLASLGLLIFVYALFRRLDNDEFEAIHTAWKIAAGQRIYIDFFQHHHPFLYYLLAPFIQFFGATTKLIYLFRFFMFSMLVGICTTTYFLAKTITNKTTALLSVILLCATPVFTVKAMEIRPDTPMLLFGMLAIMFWFFYRNSKKLSHLAASAICLSISFLFLQKAIFIIAALGLTMLLDLFKRKLTVKEIITYAATFLILPSFYFFYLFLTNSFPSYFIWNWLFNQKTSGGCPALTTFIFTVKTSTPILLLYGYGLAKIGKNYQLKLIAFFSIFLIAIFWIVPYSYTQYLTPAMPFVAIIAAFTLDRITRQNKRLLFFALLLILIPPVTINYVRRVFLSPVSEQIKKIEYVLSITKPTDKVLDSELGFEAFNLFRNDIDYFWLAISFVIPTYNRIKPHLYNVYELIEKEKPKVIGKLSITKIPPECIDKTKESVITKHYKQSELYEDILIRQN